jgi:hypothetical protein
MQPRTNGARHDRHFNAARGVASKDAVMSNAVNFDANQFLTLSPKERARRCRSMAEHARELALESSSGHRAEYLNIAKHWRMLADEIG